MINWLGLFNLFRTYLYCSELIFQLHYYQYYQVWIELMTTCDDTLLTPHFTHIASSDSHQVQPSC